MEVIAAAQEHPEDFWSHPLFVHSRNPILVADDQRRFVDANAAACLFLRRSVDAVRGLKIDDLTMPTVRPALDAMWAEFLSGTSPTPSRPWNLQMPDGRSLPVDLISLPNYRPGLHITVILFPAERGLNERLDDDAAPTDNVLTKREREVLTMVALGDTGVEIAGQLFLSPATVQTHVVNALVKLGAKNRAHGITLALQRNELDLDATPGRVDPSPSSDPR